MEYEKQQREEPVPVSHPPLEADNDESTNLDEHRAAASALVEMGVPAEYLDRAAQELERDRKRIVLWVVGAITIAATAILCSWTVARHSHPAPPPPVTVNVPAAPPVTEPAVGTVPAAASAVVARGAPHPAKVAKTPPKHQSHSVSPPVHKSVTLAFDSLDQQAWKLRSNPGTAAALTFVKDNGGRPYATLRVDRFAPNTGTYFHHEYRADLITIDGPKDLSPFQTAAFRARGTGLENVRISMAGSTGEWVSQPVTLSKDWKLFTIRLDHFEHSSTLPDAPPGTGSVHPTDVLWIGFQVGEHVNPLSAHGHADISELTFK